MSGYEIKRQFADALSFHWSGNNNQVYTTLLRLREDEAVQAEIRGADRLPVKKVYTITDKGRRELRAWLLSEPELPVFRNDLMTRLAWASPLDDSEFERMLADHEAMLNAQVTLFREKIRRGLAAPSRTERESCLWKSIAAHALGYYERELDWLRELKSMATPEKERE